MRFSGVWSEFDSPQPCQFYVELSASGLGCHPFKVVTSVRNPSSSTKFVRTIKKGSHDLPFDSIVEGLKVGRKFIVSDAWDGQTRKLFSYDCLQCNKQFFAPLKQKAKYCSRLCYNARPKTTLEFKCRVCSSLFLRTPRKAALAKHSSGFCSRKCKDFGQSLESNCLDIRPAHYGSTSSYRGKILLDKCVGCGEGRRFLLLTHHIDGDREHNKKDNLECVCFNCHVIRHLYLVDGTWMYCTKVLTPREFITELTMGSSPN